MLLAVILSGQAPAYPPMGYQMQSLDAIRKLPSSVRFESWTMQAGGDHNTDQYLFAWKGGKRYSYHLLKKGIEVNGEASAAKRNGPTTFSYDRICCSPSGTFFTLDHKVASHMNSCQMFTISSDGIHKWLKGADISTFLIKHLGKPKGETEPVPMFLLPIGFDRIDNFTYYRSISTPTGPGTRQPSTQKRSN